MRIVYVGMLLVLIGCSGDPPAPGADLVLTGGAIYTVNENQPWAEAVAVTDGRFVYVGDDAGAAAHVGTETAVHDLGGRMAIPGIVDGHTHPGLIGIEQYAAYVTGETQDEFFQAVEDAVADNPGEGWLRLCCWPNHLFISGREGPHRTDLDLILPDRPLWITSGAWHSNWLNTAGLERIGIDADTVDPAPGIATWVRDADGRPTGWVKEGAAWIHFAQQFPIVDAEAHRAEVLAFLETLSRHGVTTVYDAANLGYSDAVYSFLAELEGEGQLPLRYQGTYAVVIPEMRHLAIEEMLRFRANYGGKRLTFKTIKLFMDGINENRSGGMLDPYADDEDYVGPTMLTADELRDWLIELHEARFDLHIHAIGDLAVREALDGIELAQQAVGEEFYPRVTLAHLEIIDPGDFARFAELGVSANYTAWWLGENYNPTIDDAYGERYSSATYTVKSLFDQGANVTFSSDDWRLEVLSPFLGMQVAHTRRDPLSWLEERGGNPAAFRPPADERLSLEQMVLGFTKNGAVPFRLENEIGTIEAGKLADLVVLDENLFEMDVDAIHEVVPAAVVMEGEVIQGALP